MNTRKIVLLSLVQVAAVIYAILITAAFCKMARLSMESGGPPAGFGYVMALSFRDFGPFLFLVILAWASIMSYYSSPFAPAEVSMEMVTRSGTGLAVLYGVLGSFFAFCALSSIWG